MNKKKIIIYTTALCITVGSIFSLNTNAATTFISKGRVEDPSGNVIFDVDDLKSLDAKITQLDTSLTQLETNFDNGKDQIIEELEKNPNIDITNPDPSFPDIVQYIKQMTNIPANTYFYEKGTEGSAAIVRYKKIGTKYYKCDANGKVAQGAQEVNVSGKQLEDYAATKAGNLSAGAAGYANGGFYLGDGSDNAAYQNQGKQEGLAQGRIEGKQQGIQEGINQAKVGNATAGDVLQGKTFTNSSTVGATGTMVNNGAWTNTPSGKGKVTIPAGYHNGSGYVDTTSVYNMGYSDKAFRIALKISYNNDQSVIGIVVNSNGVDIAQFQYNLTGQSPNTWHPLGSEIELK